MVCRRGGNELRRELGTASYLLLVASPTKIGQPDRASSPPMYNAVQVPIKEYLASVILTSGCKDNATKENRPVRTAYSKRPLDSVPSVGFFCNPIYPRIAFRRRRVAPSHTCLLHKRQAARWQKCLLVLFYAFLLNNKISITI